MAKKNFKDEGPKKSIRDWAEEQLACDDVETFLNICEDGEPTDEVSLDEFLGLKEKYGF